MHVVILAGGLGTRLSEETDRIPKPMVRIGDRPILWHIMKHFGHHGFREFFVAVGHMGDVVKRYFLEYAALRRSLTVDLVDGKVAHSGNLPEDWRVHLVDTGADAGTGGRVKALEERLGDDTFMLTYGDGVSNVDLDSLVAFHRASGRLATVTAVRPPARFGGLVLDGDRVAEFTEKPQIGEGWINGGFLVCEPGLLDYLDDPRDSLEVVALERAAAEGQLAAYRHDGFWQCMDTLRDLRVLESLWDGGAAPWRVWRDD